MTVAPKLQKGLKRLLSASSLRSIASALAVISLIAMLVGLVVVLSAGGVDMSSELPELLKAAADGGIDSLIDRLGEAFNTEVVLSDGDAAASTAAGGMIAFLVGMFLLPFAIGLLPFIATILVWAGIANISKENLKFRIALFAALARIVLSIASSFAASSNSTLSTILVLLANISDTVMFLYVCDGIRELGEKLGYSNFLGKYHWIVILYVLTALFVCAGSFLGVSTAGYIIQALGYASSFIAYRLYLRALRKGFDVVEGISAEASV